MSCSAAPLAVLVANGMSTATVPTAAGSKATLAAMPAAAPTSTHPARLATAFS
jgi:hypothetical protein